MCVCECGSLLVIYFNYEFMRVCIKLKLNTDSQPVEFFSICQGMPLRVELNIIIYMYSPARRPRFSNVLCKLMLLSTVH